MRLIEEQSAQRRVEGIGTDHTCPVCGVSWRCLSTRCTTNPEVSAWQRARNASGICPDCSWRERR